MKHFPGSFASCRDRPLQITKNVRVQPVYQITDVARPQTHRVIYLWVIADNMCVSNNNRCLNEIVRMYGRCNIFLTRMKEYDKFTNISNSVKIRVCTWDNKPWRLVIRCWCFTCKNRKVVCRDDREIFIPIKEVNVECELILLQLWSKIVLSSRWPPSFKSLQITSSFLSLRSHKGHRALKNVPATGLSSSYCNLRRLRFWEVLVVFPSHGSQLSLAILLSKSAVHGMEVCILTTIIFLPQSSPVLSLSFLLRFGGNFSNYLFGLKVLTRG